MPAPAVPPEIFELVSAFRARAGEYTAAGYNETQLRAEFLNPFFAALGWDVGNTLRPRSQARREVVQEATVVVDGRLRFPDYAFRVGRRATFFAEAKKPWVKIETDRDPAFQARSYGWSAKHPLALLTDFEEFALYDTRVPPAPGDDAEERRVLYLRFDEYADRWGEIADKVSRDAVLDGRFAAYVAGLPGGRSKKTREVDDAFLADIERWRETLAVDLAARNPALTVRQLNFAVQATIDRLVFLRICEDRGLEAHGTLVGLLGEDVYDGLTARFEEADAKYNSGLFHFRKESGRPGEPDALTPSLAAGDAALETVILGLYENPYSFAVLPADILGQIYERFLGKVIRLPDGPGGAAAVEEKPEVLKAGGVYYTPTYIVDYIVDRTVGELLAGRTVVAAERRDRRLDRPLRVLDPACGSGSFLLGAYQRLLDWYLDWYVAHDPETLAGVRNPPVRLAAGKGGGWLLTTAERRRILLAHLYGVDVDAQAVEVSKLSLLLKVLEGDPDVPEDRLFAGARVLPDLSGNVKCGNSLIGTDFYDGAQGTLFDAEARLRVNAFDWDGPDGFPDVMTDGGFEAVIGNPPYLSFSGRQAADIPEDEAAYFDRHFVTDGWQTTHGMFLQKVTANLSQAWVGMIVPDQVGHLDGYAPVRRLLAESAQVREVRYWGEKVFRGVVTPALTLLLQKGGAGLTVIMEEDGRRVDCKLASGAEWSDPTANRLLSRATERSVFLGKSVADPGVHTGNCSKKIILSAAAASETTVPVLEGKQVGRYRCDEPLKVLDLGYKPSGDEYFTIRPLDKYQRAPFVIRQTAPHPIVGPRVGADYFRNSLLALYPLEDGTAVEYVVALLNSRLMRYFYTQTVRESRQKAFPQVKVGSLRKLPIYKVRKDQPSGVEAHDRLSELVGQICELHRQLDFLTTPQEKTALRRQIDGLDRRIDALVYELYGLTAEEIAVVEAATAE